MNHAIWSVPGLPATRGTRFIWPSPPLRRFLRQDNKPHFYRASTRPNTADTEFDVSGLDKLPQVDIVYAYGNYNSIALDAFAHFTGVQASRLTKLWRLFSSHSGTDCTRGTYGSSPASDTARGVQCNRATDIEDKTHRWFGLLCALRDK